MTYNIVDIIISIARSVADIDSRHVIPALMEPEKMPKAVFASLQKLSEDMDMDVAQGHDCNPGFDEKRREVERVMDAAPWTLSHDHGIVLKADLETLDMIAASERQAEALLAEQLPSWAIGRTTEWTEIGAQLRTKDGRRCGNAIVISQNAPPSVRIVTDVGTVMHLTERELMETFHPVEFKMDIIRHPGVRKILGLPLEPVIEEQPLTEELWVSTCNRRDIDLESQRNLMWSVIKSAGLTDALQLALNDKHPIEG